MPNVDNPFGLHPIARTNEGGIPMTQTFLAASAYAGAIRIGDCVNRVATGYLESGARPISGVNLGGYRVASAGVETEHVVIISPSATYVIQDNNDTDGVAFADLGLNGDIEFNAGTGQKSGHELDESTLATTGTLDVHVLSLFKTPDNDFGANARVIVAFNAHRMHNATAGV